MWSAEASGAEADADPRLPGHPPAGPEEAERGAHPLELPGAWSFNVRHRGR